MEEELITITIQVPRHMVARQRGIHATSVLDSKFNFYMTAYHKRLLLKAAELLDVKQRSFVRQVVIRAAAEVIAHFEGTRPPTEIEE